MYYDYITRPKLYISVLKSLETIDLELKHTKPITLYQSVTWYVIYNFPCPSFAMISKSNLCFGITIGLGKINGFSGLVKAPIYRRNLHFNHFMISTIRMGEDPCGLPPIHNVFISTMPMIALTLHWTPRGRQSIFWAQLTLPFIHQPRK